MEPVLRAVLCSVFPNNDFLLEKISTASSPKPAEQPFLMPSTSAILDNNFFVHRQILVWRYLAADCKPEGGNLKCQQDPGDSVFWFRRTEPRCTSAWNWWEKKKSRSAGPTANFCDST